MERRSPIMAVVMFCIPFVGIYLIYKWWTELKEITNSDLNPVVNTVLCLIPLVNLYFMWKFFTNVEELAKPKGLAYPQSATIMMVAAILTTPLLGLGLLVLLFMAFKTQEMMNAL